MRPHPRIRKTIKYGGAALTVLLVVVWIGSGWLSLMWSGMSGDWVNVAAGCVKIYHFAKPSEAGVPATWNLDTFDAPFNWGFDGLISYAGWTVTFPLWLPFLVVLLPTALAFRLDTLARRREREGKCPKCHYDRTGLAVDAVCPECGAAPR